MSIATRLTRIAALCVAIAGGCGRARIVDAGADDAGFDAGVPAEDAGADAGPDPGTDAGPDAGPDPGPDAGPDSGLGEIVFQDDFDDGSFDDDWILRNASASQIGGALVSGTSCMSAVDCTEGPLLLYTRDLFPVGDGRMTIEYDVYTGVNARYQNRVIVDLEAEVAGRRIAANADGSTRDLDPALRGFWHIGGSEPFHLIEACARCQRADRVALTHGDDFIAADDTWYHIRLSFCGAAGLGIRVTSMAGAVLLEDSSPLLNASVSADVTQVYALVWLEGAGKRIDNLVIRRGCVAP